MVSTESLFVQIRRMFKASTVCILNIRSCKIFSVRHTPSALPVGIHGNEFAYEAAREASLLANIDIPHVLFQDMMLSYRHFTRNEWQRRWVDVAVNKLKELLG